MTRTTANPRATQLSTLLLGGSVVANMAASGDDERVDPIDRTVGGGVDRAGCAYGAVDGGGVAGDAVGGIGGQHALTPRDVCGADGEESDDDGNDEYVFHVIRCTEGRGSPREPSRLLHGPGDVLHGRFTGEVVGWEPEPSGGTSKPT